MQEMEAPKTKSSPVLSASVRFYNANHSHDDDDDDDAPATTKRSLMSDIMNAEKEQKEQARIVQEGRMLPDGGATKQQEGFSHQEAQSEQRHQQCNQNHQHYHHHHRTTTSTATPRNSGDSGRLPQDRRSFVDSSSTTAAGGGGGGVSITSLSAGSQGSKYSTATPNLIFTTSTLPVTSPPFPLISPANGRGRRMDTKSSPLRTTTTTTSTTATKTTESHHGSILLSPPKMKTKTVRSNVCSSPLNTSNVPREETCCRKSPSLMDIRNEIHELTSQFAKLEQESQQRRAIFDLDPQDRFDESLDIMGKKAHAMVDVLHRNYIQLSQLSRENKNLKQQMQKIKAENILSKTNTNADQEVLDENGISTPSNTLRLLEKLDSSDHYVHRTYPSVPKTPGTMFTTELVEVMKLDVGEHAYLAQIMDRQWNTSTDYRPKQQPQDDSCT
jgi:hypothetical protein